MLSKVNQYSGIAPQPNAHPPSKRLGMCAKITCLFFATLALLLSPVTGAESTACAAWKHQAQKLDEQVGTVQTEIFHTETFTDYRLAEVRALRNRLSMLQGVANGYGVISSKNCDIANPDRAQAAHTCVQDQSALSATYDEIRVIEMELAQAISLHPNYVDPADLQHHQSQKPEGCS